MPTELLQRLCVLAMEQALAAADEALAASDPWAGLSGYIRTCVELRDTAARSTALSADIVVRAHAGRPPSLASYVNRWSLQPGNPRVSGLTFQPPEGAQSLHEHP